MANNYHKFRMKRWSDVAAAGFSDSLVRWDVFQSDRGSCLDADRTLRYRKVLFSETGHVTAASPQTRRRKRLRERPHPHILAAGSVFLAPGACSAYQRAAPPPKRRYPLTHRTIPRRARAGGRHTCVEVKRAEPEAGGRQQKAPCCRCSSNTSWQRRGREGICCAVCSLAAMCVNIEPRF